MKKVFLLVCCAFFLFAGCKKDYVCECKMSLVHFDGHNMVSEDWKGATQSYEARMTKKQAKMACDAEQNNVQTNFMDTFTDNGNYPLPQGMSLVASCTLK